MTYDQILQATQTIGFPAVFTSGLLFVVYKVAKYIAVKSFEFLDKFFDSHEKRESMYAKERETIIQMHKDQSAGWMTQIENSRASSERAAGYARDEHQKMMQLAEKNLEIGEKILERLKHNGHS